MTTIKLLSSLTLACFAMTLSGCSTQTIQEPPVKPLVIESDDPLIDRAHVRDDSALYQKSSRGGAAFRDPEITQVLYNDHHIAEGALNVAEVKMDESQRMKNKNNANHHSATSNASSKESSDKRVDRSIYSAPNSKKDRSIYANALRNVKKNLSMNSKNSKAFRTSYTFKDDNMIVTEYDKDGKVISSVTVPKSKMQTTFPVKE